MVLCKNELIDYENLVIEQDELLNLKILNLEGTNNNKFELINDSFGNLPSLEKLILNSNGLK